MSNRNPLVIWDPFHKLMYSCEECSNGEWVLATLALAFGLAAGEKRQSWCDDEAADDLFVGYRRSVICSVIEGLISNDRLSIIAS